jgi:hypothetical protein
MRKIYKVVDLFGNEEVRFSETTTRKPDLFSDHDAFVEKFEAKKTTDDCYTPTEVYAIVLQYVADNFDLTGKQILRPFHPGGDFESVEYGPDSVVIDNPPFSIITKIARFYIDKAVPFFLFAPHLTLFGSDMDCTHIVVGGDLIYDNGARVKTSFLSNMFGDAKVIGEPELFRKFKELAEKNKTNLPKYEYPANVLTVSSVTWIVSRGIGLRIDKGSAAHCRGLDDQKKHGKALFGSGFLISDAAAAEKAAAEKAAAEKDHLHIWELSEKERAIIRALGSTETDPQQLEIF